MPTSTRFRELRKRLRALRRHLLPRRFSPTGAYDDRVLDRARGYRLLVHAEIEAFIEDIAKNALISQAKAWKNGRKATQLIVSLLASYHSGFPGKENDPATLPVTSRPVLKERVDEAVEKATVQYLNKLTDNHGVRLDNLRRLLLPVGVDLDMLDQTWLTNIDEFGKRRGELAHKTVGAQQAIDPQTEYLEVQALLVGLKNLDEIIVGLAA